MNVTVCLTKPWFGESGKGLATSFTLCGSRQSMGPWGASWLLAIECRGGSWTLGLVLALELFPVSAEA